MTASEQTVGDGSEEWVESPDIEERVEEELSIGRRIADWKSLVSFGFAILVLAVVIAKAGINPHLIWDRLRTLNIFLFVSAFLVYYATFPIRGYRWKVLLENAYDRTDPEAVSRMHVGGLTEILYISWFVNCVVPAKLGDLYRAYLAKLWVHISWTKTVGTILAERIIDILVLSALLAGTGFIMFHNRLTHVSTILAMGLALALAGIVALLAMKTCSEQIRRRVPERFLGRYIAFEEGTLHSFQRVPLLLGVTLVIWLFEGVRLQLVFASLGLHPHISSVPFIPMLFFALGTAVLTTLPFTPGGLGLVEAGLGSLMIYLGIHASDAAAVVLVDRLLSYYSVALIGFVVYLVSKRSHFRHPS